MWENIKARMFAKKYNIWTEEIDPNRKSDIFIFGDWIYKDTLYYGHPLFTFFESFHNRWYKYKKSTNN